MTKIAKNSVLSAKSSKPYNPHRRSAFMNVVAACINAALSLVYYREFLKDGGDILYLAVTTFFVALAVLSSFTASDELKKSRTIHE